MIAQEQNFLEDSPLVAPAAQGNYQPQAFNADQIQAAINASRQQGFSDADILKGAQANYGVDVTSYLNPTPVTVPQDTSGIASLPVTYQPVVQDTYQPAAQPAFGSTDLVSQVTAWKPANEWGYDPNNQFAGTNITLADGQVVPYNAIVEQVLKRYDEDKKNPTLAVKSGVQLGIPDDVLRTLPGVDASALIAGHQLVDSGAFEQIATNRATTESDLYGQSVAPVGSALYNARIAAGLDAYGLPPRQVEALKAAGKYVDPNTQAAGQVAPNVPVAQPVADEGSTPSAGIASLNVQPVAQPESPKYSTDQIISAINESRKQGFSDADIIKGAQANFGVDVASLVNAGPALKNTITTTLADTTKSDIEKLGIINKAAADNNLTPAQVAQATGLNPTAVTKIFDTFNTGITSVVNKLSEPTVSDIDKTKSLLQLQSQYGVTDDQLAKSMGKSVDEVKSYLDPVRNFSTQLTDTVTNKTAADLQAFIDTAKKDPRVDGLYSAALDNIQKKVPILELRDSLAGTAKGMDVAKGYTDFVAAVNADPALKEQYGTQAAAIQKVIDVSQHAADESYGGKTQPWMFSTFMGLDKNTVSNTPTQLEYSEPTTKEVTRTINGRGGERQVTETVNVPAAPKGATPVYETSRDRDRNQVTNLTGYSKEVTMPGDVNGDWKITANYDVNGKLTGYSLPGRDLWASDDVKYIPTWDASGKAKPFPVDAKNRGVLGGAVHDIQKMGPIGQIMLMAATGGLGSLAAGALAQAGMGTVLSQALGSGLVGGGMSSLGGGNFAQGFAGGSLGSFGTQLAQGYMPTINTGTPLLDQYLTKALPNLAGAEFSAAATGQDLGKTGLASLINTGTNMATNSLIKGAMPDTLSPELQKAFSGVSGQLLTSLLQGQSPDFQKAIMNTIVQNAMTTAKDAVKTATKKE
jgi:hypothetical protein